MQNQKKDRMRAFVAFYRPYLGWFLADVLCSMLCAGAALVMPLLVRVITGNAEAGGLLPETLWRVGGAMLLLILLWTGCRFFYDAMGHVMGAKMERDMRKQLFAKYLRLPVSFYDQEKTGRLLSRLTGDTVALAELFHHGPEDLIIYSLQFIGSLVILFHTNARLTWAVCALLPLVLLYSLIFQRKLRHSYRRNREIIGDVNARVEDTLSGIRVVKAFCAEAQEQEKFDRENERFLGARSDIYKKESYYYGGLEDFFGQLIPALVVVLGGWLVSKQSLALPDLITFMLYVGYLISPMKGLANTIRLYQEGLAGFTRYIEIMEQPEEPAQAALPAARARGAVAYENVSFRYGEQYAEVLRDVSLRVEPGQTVALVGSSGVGKTTFCALLPRFYEITGGTITLDGQDIRSMPLHALRSQIGIVQQDVYLFDGTVLENIRYGLADCTREQAEEAARQAGAHEFITQLPNGYDTEIGQRGVRLSGGQKQRISIARVFLLNPPVLIFDEATSALDQESEQVVMRSLELLSRGRTTFIVAHRYSTVRHAQRIVVLEEGRIVEEGPHERLLAAHGRYAQLYSAQGDEMQARSE